MDFISKELSLKTTDGRQIRGVLLAVDHQANLLLTNAAEFHPETQKSREIGLVSVPKCAISTISV